MDPDYGGDAVTSLPSRMVAVSATDHSELDDWVIEQAKAEAIRSGWQLAEYLGREDVLPEPRQPGLCCHLFAAEGDE